MLTSKSNILYVRAAIKPLKDEVVSSGGFIPFLKKHVAFDEIFVPLFTGARKVWKKKPNALPRATNSGTLGKIIVAHPGSILSQHPSHAFAGFGSHVEQVLSRHDDSKSCFFPIAELADSTDFSMLLLGCVDESPGFSTVHAAQFKLGLSQKHLYRYLLRWDMLKNGKVLTKTAPEHPGCSLSFSKFYPYYEADGNLLKGSWCGVDWLFVPSAKRALATEMKILKNSGRFVDCGHRGCLSCRLRLY